jgi:hypothetical protein
VRLAEDFLATELAARIAAPSSPVLASIESATFDHWRLALEDLALCVNRDASDGVQGMVYPRFLVRRLLDFFSAMRVALRKNETGWERDSISAVS